MKPGDILRISYLSGWRVRHRVLHRGGRHVDSPRGARTARPGRVVRFLTTLSPRNSSAETRGTRVSARTWTGRVVLGREGDARGREGSAWTCRFIFSVKSVRNFPSDVAIRYRQREDLGDRVSVSAFRRIPCASTRPHGCGQAQQDRCGRFPTDDFLWDGDSRAAKRGLSASFPIGFPLGDGVRRNFVVYFVPRGTRSRKMNPAQTRGLANKRKSRQWFRDPW